MVILARGFSSDVCFVVEFIHADGMRKKNNQRMIVDKTLFITVLLLEDEPIIPQWNIVPKTVLKGCSRKIKKSLCIVIFNRFCEMK